MTKLSKIAVKFTASTDITKVETISIKTTPQTKLWFVNEQYRLYKLFAKKISIGKIIEMLCEKYIENAEKFPLYELSEKRSRVSQLTINISTARKKWFVLKQFTLRNTSKDLKKISIGDIVELLILNYGDRE